LSSDESAVSTPTEEVLIRLATLACFVQEVLDLVHTKR
jgi:hypothetical protein